MLLEPTHRHVGGLFPGLAAVTHQPLIPALALAATGIA